jgi:CHAD domain-containing protein
MADLTRELLERPTEETARVLCLGFLDEATEAAERLKKGEDPEALHDFRVGLRRLRSCLRAYRPYLEGSITKKDRKRIKDLASSTNLARDTEVQLEWLKPQLAQLTDKQKVGAEWLVASLNHRIGADQTPHLQEVMAEFHRLRPKLMQRLTIVAYQLDPTQRESRTSFLAVTGGLLIKHVNQLEEQLSGVHGVQDHEKIHDARIGGKRLRYLLEPLRKEIPAAKSFVKNMKALQDVLGELHDTKVLEDEISAALEKSAIERARRIQEVLAQQPITDGADGDVWEERHGLVELLRLLKARGNGLFEKATVEFLGEKGKSFFRSIEETAQRLSSEGGSQETHRKFLLRQIPESAKSMPSRLTDEGWLPGKPPQEILRRERSGRKVTHYRVIHDGMPEQVTRSYFSKLWPLTERKRLRKRCYELKAGRTEWIISDFMDRDLILDECNQPPGEAELELPDWIKEVLTKEVTGIKKYDDARIAAIRQRDSSAGS